MAYVYLLSDVHDSEYEVVMSVHATLEGAEKAAEEYKEKFASVEQTSIQAWDVID